MKDYSGKDNCGHPKQEFLDHIHAMDDHDLEDETGKYIWLSVYAANNPRSDYHWKCDACYDECETRDDKRIYSRAHKAQMKSCGHA